MIAAANQAFRRSELNDQGTQTEERDPIEQSCSPTISLYDHDQQGRIQTASDSGLEDRTSTPENSVPVESPPLSNNVWQPRDETREDELKSAYIKYLEAKLEEAHKLDAKCKKDIKRQVNYHLNQQAALALHDEQHKVLLEVSQFNLDLQARYSALSRWAHSLHWENASLMEQIVLIMQQYDALRVGPYAPATCAAESMVPTDVK